MKQTIFVDECLFDMPLGINLGSLVYEATGVRTLFLNYTTYHHEHLLKTTNSPSIPSRFEFDTISIATEKMFRENHNKSLRKKWEIIIEIFEQFSSQIIKLINVEISTKLFSALNEMNTQNFQYCNIANQYCNTHFLYSMSLQIRT